jgi:serine carboxypeptidase-like clade 4
MMSANLVAWCLCQQVHDAGHMVPMDQPEASLEMLKRWTRGTLSEATEEPQQLVAEI